jgi:ribosomal protein S18 acetylase RimI-like enzyme
MNSFSKKNQGVNLSDCLTRKLKAKDISKIVALHLESFPDFFLSFLGKRFLQEFYNNFVVDSMGVGLVAQDSNGKIIGIIVGPLNPNRFFSRLLKRRWWAFCIASVEAVIKRPSCIKRLSRAVFYRGQEPAGPPRALLSSIAVSPNAQKLGIGSKLVFKWIEEVKNRGGNGCYLTTDAVGNNDVNTFYQRLGWKIETTYRTPEGRLMNIYIFNFRSTPI